MYMHWSEFLFFIEYLEASIDIQWFVTFLATYSTVFLTNNASTNIGKWSESSVRTSAGKVYDGPGLASALNVVVDLFVWMCTIVQI